MRLNSVIFHTQKLSQVRNFYENILNLKVGQYEKNGESVEDSSDSYVNFQLGDFLLCFEYEESRVDLGTLVIHVESLHHTKELLMSSGLEISGKSGQFFKVKDPDGRTIIIEEGNPS